MPWPTDPERRAAALQRHREAQRARWERQEERERAAAATRAQFADPSARAKMSEVKLRQYQERPELRRKVAEGVAAYCAAHPRERRPHAPRARKTNHEARLAVARNRDEARARRLSLIAQLAPRVRVVEVSE